MKKSLISILALSALICVSLITVNAAGNVSATFTGSDNVNIGETFTLDLTADNVEGSSDGKIYAFGGYVTYDPEYLEYVSFTGASGWTGSSNNNNERLKISTVDFSLNQGVASGSIGKLTFKALKAGRATISMNTIEATDQEKNIDAVFTPKTVTIIDPDHPLSSDSSLKSLNIAGYTLSPSFTSNNTSYEMTVPNNITGLNVTAIANDENATVSVSGNTNWVVGENTIEITVTAVDGSETIYRVVVNREATTLSSNTNVNLNILTEHTISPSFSNSINDYEVNVDTDVTSLNMEITPEDEKTNIVINGNENFTDENQVEIVVTAEDGTIRVIILNVTRTNLPNADLSDLKIDGTTITDFDPDTLTYTLESVTNDKDSINITATPADENATVTGDGSQNLIFGDNSFDIVVTAADNQTTKTYRINIAKIMKGDINYDGRVTLLDIRLILQRMLNNDYNDREKWIMDYNDDDRATLLDIRAILQWILNN